MKILLKRNDGSDSLLPMTVSAGEPVWYKDTLFIGSVGSENGGIATNPGELISLSTPTVSSSIAICESSSGDVAKVAQMSGFVLAGGESGPSGTFSHPQSIIMYTTAANSASGATLNVNNTGAKPIKINGTSATTNSNFPSGYWRMVYNGTNWCAYPLTANFATITHSHGKINNYGRISSTSTIASGDSLCFIDNSNLNSVSRSTITFGTNTTTFLANDGTWRTPSGGSGTGGSTVTGYNVSLSTTEQKFVTVDNTDYKISLPATDPYTSARTPSSHSHGNISNNGKVSASVTIASGDALCIADSSNSGLVAKSSIKFGTGTTTFLANNGQWLTPSTSSGTDLSEWDGRNIEIDSKNSILETIADNTVSVYPDDSYSTDSIYSTTSSNCFKQWKKYVNLINPLYSNSFEFLIDFSLLYETYAYSDGKNDMLPFINIKEFFDYVDGSVYSQTCKKLTLNVINIYDVLSRDDTTICEWYGVDANGYSYPLELPHNRAPFIFSDETDFIIQYQSEMTTFPITVTNSSIIGYDNVDERSIASLNRHLLLYPSLVFSQGNVDIYYENIRSFTKFEVIRQIYNRQTIYHIIPYCSSPFHIHENWEAQAPSLVN